MLKQLTEDLDKTISLTTPNHTLYPSWNMEEETNRGRVQWRKWWGTYDSATDTYSDLLFYATYLWDSSKKSRLLSVAILTYATDGSTVLNTTTIELDEKKVSDKKRRRYKRAYPRTFPLSLADIF